MMPEDVGRDLVCPEPHAPSPDPLSAGCRPCAGVVAANGGGMGYARAMAITFAVDHVRSASEPWATHALRRGLGEALTMVVATARAPIFAAALDHGGAPAALPSLGSLEARLRL